MANHRTRRLQLAHDLPFDRDRSILAAAGIKPEYLGVPGHCRICGRAPIDGAEFDPSLGDGIELAVDAVCSWCEIRRARIQFGGPIYQGIRVTRMKRFGTSWRQVLGATDGAAWMHDGKALRVIESLQLVIDDEPELVARDGNRIRKYLSGVPFVERTEFGSAIVVRSLDGSDDIHRERVDHMSAEDGRPPRYNGAGVTGALDEQWPDETVRAVWDWNARQGWRWWHHLAIARNDGRWPDFNDLDMVRRAFITGARECYQVFPPEDLIVNLHPNTVHLWHCVDASSSDPSTGRVLPAFDLDLVGQAVRPLSTQ